VTATNAASRSPTVPFCSSPNAATGLAPAWWPRLPRLAGRCSRRQKCTSLNESGALPALLDPAGWSSPIARRKVT